MYRSLAFHEIRLYAARPRCSGLRWLPLSCFFFTHNYRVPFPAFPLFFPSLFTASYRSTFSSLYSRCFIGRAIISRFPYISVPSYVTWLTLFFRLLYFLLSLYVNPPLVAPRVLLLLPPPLPPLLPFLSTPRASRLAPYLRVCFFRYNSSLSIPLLDLPLSHLCHALAVPHPPPSLSHSSSLALPPLSRSLSTPWRSLSVALTARNQYIPLRRLSPLLRDRPATPPTPRELLLILALPRFLPFLSSPLSLSPSFIPHDSFLLSFPLFHPFCYPIYPPRKPFSSLSSSSSTIFESAVPPAAPCSTTIKPRSVRL